MPGLIRTFRHILGSTKYLPVRAWRRCTETSGTGVLARSRRMGGCGRGVVVLVREPLYRMDEYLRPYATGCLLAAVLGQGKGRLADFSGRLRCATLRQC